MHSPCHATCSGTRYRKNLRPILHILRRLCRWSRVNGRCMVLKAEGNLDTEYFVLAMIIPKRRQFTVICEVFSRKAKFKFQAYDKKSGFCPPQLWGELELGIVKEDHFLQMVDSGPMTHTNKTDRWQACCWFQGRNNPITHSRDYCGLGWLEEQCVNHPLLRHFTAVGASNLLELWEGWIAPNPTYLLSEDLVAFRWNESFEKLSIMVVNPYEVLKISMSLKYLLVSKPDWLSVGYLFCK